MNAALEGIRRKVEAGDVLSPEELGELEAAARADAGPTLKLALAHAWMNAEENRRALELLNMLRRSFPRELQVVLGYGRALASLERYGDAERAMHDALELNPGDPEALKVLAILAMRRGEHARARELIAEVLTKDPLDGEAKLVREELDAAELSGAPLPKASRAEFVDALLASLLDKGVRHLRRASELWVRSDDGGVARLDLRGLYAAYLEEGRDLSSAVEAIAGELSSAANLPKTRQDLLARVMPVLRPDGFVARAEAAVHREGPAGLRLFYVLDDPDLVRYVPQGALRTHDVSIEELDRAAWQNLEARPPQPRPVIVSRGEPRLAPEPFGLWAVCEGDGYDAPRLLTQIGRERLESAIGPGPFRVALGRRELVLVCLVLDASAVGQLASLKSAEDGIAGDFSLVAGRLVRN
jgi:tetratricopeptide (TPR) repeat protein